MDDLISNNIKEKEKIKNKLIEFMVDNNITYSLFECCSCERICLDFYGEEESCQKHCCNSRMNIVSSNKEIHVIYPKDILYISIENRKSVVYLTNRKLETNYSFAFWKSLLELKIFAQPHYSYIVNLNYVDMVTKEFVKIRYEDVEYTVYASLRKINSFKKALLDFKCF